MAFTIKVKKKTKEIKFNYLTLFKVNKKLGNKDKDGQSQNDGAGVLFAQVLEQEDDALVNLITLLTDWSENEALEAIENYMDNLGIEDEEAAYTQIFEDLKEEMLVSGFFLKKVKKYIENLDKATVMLKAKMDEDSQQQAKQVEELATKMKSEISSLTVPDED